MARTPRKPGPIRHGTLGGWQTERNRGVPHCEACIAARKADSRTRYAGIRCAPGLGWPLAPGRVPRDVSSLGAA